MSLSALMGVAPNSTCVYGVVMVDPDFLCILYAHKHPLTCVASSSGSVHKCVLCSWLVLCLALSATQSCLANYNTFPYYNTFQRTVVYM